MTAAIEELLRYAGPAHIVSNRFTAEPVPGLRLAADPRTLTWRPSSLMHALTELPVATRS
jgi:hypothetical protein